MPSVIVLRAIVSATLGLGSLDLALINVVLGPQDASEPPIDSPSALPQPRGITLEPATVTPLETPAPPREERVYFATMSADLDGRSRELLAGLAHASGEIVLEGHADVRGDEQLNRSLSKQRAVAVADQLAALGIPRTRIRIAFVGTAGASTTGPLWRDRRVEIRIGGSR